MAKIEYEPQGICPRLLRFEVEDNKLKGFQDRFQKALTYPQSLSLVQDHHRYLRKLTDQSRLLLSLLQLHKLRFQIERRYQL